MFDWLKRRRRQSNKYPPAPGGCVVYAIGDIHGRADCLQWALASIDRDREQKTGPLRVFEIYLGDYVDRGPHSRQVLDLLIARANIASTVFLRGNHETLLESFLKGLIGFEAWRPLGGLETALSYGVDPNRLKEGSRFSPLELATLMPIEHFHFLSATQAYHSIGSYCFVHAGIRPGIPLVRQTIEDLTWIREDFLECDASFGSIVVHGHTPMREMDFRHNRINIDTGAYITNCLSVLKIDQESVTSLKVHRP